MARTLLATFPPGNRTSVDISLGVVAKFIPAGRVHDVLRQTFFTRIVHPDESLYI